MKNIILTLTAILLFTGISYAEPPSLKGLKQAPFVVDLNQGSGEVLALRLKLILRTMDDLEAEGVKPVTVVAVRGQASRFMTVTDKYINADDRAVKPEIYALIKKLTDRGVRIEQCNIALGLLKIDPADVHKELHVVKNGYVSLIGWQDQGYAILPME